MYLHGACRQPVRDDEHNVKAAPMRRQRGLRTRREAAAQVRTHQIALPVFGRTGNRKHRESQRCYVGDQSRLVERLANRIARAGVRELEIE